MRSVQSFLLRGLGFSLSWYAVNAGIASITLSLDKLDASDGLPLPPANIVIVDVFIDVSADDSWSAGAIYGSTFFGNSGAHLTHATRDPNETPVFTAPGADNRFVTFVSLPRGRDAEERFSIDGAAGVTGRRGPSPILTDSTIDLVWYRSPPPFPPPPEIGVDGYVMRVALDLSTVTDPAFRVDSENIIVVTSPPPGALVLFQSSGPTEGGTYVTTHTFADYGTNWGIYGIPEPASGLILLLGCCYLLRRSLPLPPVTARRCESTSRDRPDRSYPRGR